MSENSPEDPEEIYDGDKIVKMRRSAIDALEKASGDGKRAVRELAFIKAGINPEDPKLSYFVKGYEGDITADQIRQAAITAGFIQDPAAASDEAVQRAGDAAERVANAGSGQAPNTTSGDRASEYAEALKSGGMNALAELASRNGPVVGHNI